jgi:hypothetical protein
MIASSSPATLDTVAARWAAVALALQQAQEDLLRHTRAATAHWTGTAAEAFTARATELHHSIGNGAAYASHACSGVSYAAEALRTARSDMPPEPASLEGVVTSEQARIAGTATDTLHEQQRKQAVAVMEQLEERYAAAAEMIGTPTSLEQNHDRGEFVPTAETSPSQLKPAELIADGPRLAAQSPRALDQSGGSSRGSAGIEHTSVPDQTTASVSAPDRAEAVRDATFQRRQAGEIHLSELADCQPAPTAGPGTTPPAGRIADIQASSHEVSAPSSLRTEFPPTSPLWNFSRGTIPSGTNPDDRGTQNSRIRVVGGPLRGPGTLPEVTGGTGRTRGQQLGAQLPEPTGSSKSAGWFGPHTTRSRDVRIRNRPEYLTEDERTWLCELNVNPPVIT